MPNNPHFQSIHPNVRNFDPFLQCARPRRPFPRQANARQERLARRLRPRGAANSKSITRRPNLYSRECIAAVYADQEAGELSSRNGTLTPAAGRETISRRDSFESYTRVLPLSAHTLTVFTDYKFMAERSVYIESSGEVHRAAARPPTHLLFLFLAILY